MGWTHHWLREPELAKVLFAAAVKDCRLILPFTGVSLAGADRSGKPSLRQNAIIFNGANPASCERFLIQQTEIDRRGLGNVWSFCKTAHLPYDLCVQVALIILQHHMGDAIAIGSDGTDDHWTAARDLCQQHLGYGSEFRLNTR